jgi:group I intron endonuclease
MRHNMKAAVIYKIINTLNNKFYVGSTNNQYERFRTHRNKLRKHKHHCAHLQSAWIKYGESAFVFHVVEVLSDSSFLQDAEDKWLTEWVGHPDCYNHGMRSGAPWRGVKKELHPMYGKKASLHTKELIRAARLTQPDPRIGTKHSEETKAKISASKLANPVRPWQGKERSEETRKKIGDSQRGVKKAPRVYSPEGLERAKINMLKNAREQKPLDFCVVKAKFSEKVLNKYDFENAVYTGALNRIEGCVCPSHGVFSQYAVQFRKGRGCPSCGAEERVQTRNQFGLKA